ncbi:MAG: SbcC/MukB-like Walker B domain-containing protein, partial [Saprospiraceae bacterium]
KLDAALLQLKTTRESLADRQKQLTKGAGQVAKLTEQLTKKSTKLGFADLASVLAARLISTEAERIELQRAELERTANETQSLYENCVAELAKEQASALTDQPISTLQLQAQEQQLAADELMQTVGSLNEKIAENDRRKSSATELTKRIETQRKEYQRWATLNSIIGSASGKVFRSFAQGLTLRTLTQLANQHLTNLNGRYFIKKSPVSDLELNIVDTYQANNERSMNTLSGGESFLVSLSLALGLSDLAGRDTTIRSLFIDEGFGTLDEATLDVAITTLENLQAAGKTIGVISHVKALKERIGTQIQVKKRGNGVSEIAVV